MTTQTVLLGDVFEQLATLPNNSIHCIVTSPPYWGLRDYNHDKQLGLEPTLTEYLEKLRGIFKEFRRVLHPTGVVYFNIGDAYTSGGRKTRATDIKNPEREMAIRAANPLGLKNKDLMLIPTRLAILLQDDGWYLRSDIIWMKNNPMPESVRDRPTSAHEHIFLFTAAQNYYYDAIAVAEPTVRGYAGSTFDSGKTNAAGKGRSSKSPRYDFGTKNQRNVWAINPQNFPGAHFAVFPTDIPRRAIKAGTSARGVCPTCLYPWKRVLERRTGEPGGTESGTYAQGSGRKDGGIHHSGGYRFAVWETVGWTPTCKCPEHEPVPATVLDPFVGSGTTLQVAKELGRNAIGIELQPEYLQYIEQRLASVKGPV